MKQPKFWQQKETGQFNHYHYLHVYMCKTQKLNAKEKNVQEATEMEMLYVQLE